MSYILSVDAGGTFLDLVVVNSDGRIGVGKALHTPEKPENGIFAGIAQAAEPFGISVDVLLAD
jgi:N-methylhydantoinase A/oxoprolinase/acetone carboxylase beta subunit